MKKVLASGIVVSILLPLVAYAQSGIRASVSFGSGADSCPTSGSGRTLCSIINVVIDYANLILVLMMGIAIVMFVFYVIKYYIKADSERKEGGKYVMYSLIGFFVILSFWGLVNILQNSFGLQNSNNKAPGWQSFMDIFPEGGSSNQRTTTSGGVFNDPCPNGSASGPNCQ